MGCLESSRMARKPPHAHPAFSPEKTVTLKSVISAHGRARCGTTSSLFGTSVHRFSHTLCSCLDCLLFASAGYYTPFLRV